MVLVYAEQEEGRFKKPAFESLTYGVKTAELLGLECHALVLGDNDRAASLGHYGVKKVYQVKDESFHQFDSQTFASAIQSVIVKTGAKVLILSFSAAGRSLAGRLSISWEAGLVSGANRLPGKEEGALIVGKSVFSGKAQVEYSMPDDKAIISVMGNSLKPEKAGDADCPVTAVKIDVTAPRVKVIEVKRASGKVPLPEAELVVSAGRGMKEASNWDIIEELAEVLGATTACSRPVADTGWRPHHEHVGQTGLAIRPNLYIAVGISGAIQHLAGVNNSRVIVVINKDPEAPFFKAADYGVVGDLFEVVPRLTEALKRFKGSQS